MTLQQPIVTVRLVRWILTTLLLVVGWKHSHWSVALCLTLLSIGNEATFFVLQTKANLK